MRPLMIDTFISIIMPVVVTTKFHDHALRFIVPLQQGSSVVIWVTGFAIVMTLIVFTVLEYFTNSFCNIDFITPFLEKEIIDKPLVKKKSYHIIPFTMRSNPLAVDFNHSIKTSLV